MTENKNFLGIPVEGDINRGETRVPQKSLAELTPLLQAVLSDPNVGRFGWRQYTPYFNDGDPCIFGVRSLWADPPAGVRTEEGGDEDYEYKHDGIEYDHRWGERSRKWDSETRTWSRGPYEGPDEATYDRLIALDTAMQTGTFDNVLLDHFGDHADITITREAIQVEEYSHD